MKNLLIVRFPKKGDDGTINFISRMLQDELKGTHVVVCLNGENESNQTTFEEVILGERKIIKYD